MNFKIFQSARKSQKTDQPNETQLSTSTEFVSQFKCALDNGSVDKFIADLFKRRDVGDLCDILSSFFESFEFLSSKWTFFYVFDAVCRHIYLLDQPLAKNIIQIIVATYYAKNIYNDVKEAYVSLLNYLVTNLPATLLEDAVLSNYVDIVNELNYEDIDFIAMYPSWRRKIPECFDVFMRLMMNESFENFVDFANKFPECAPLVYEHILLCMLGKGDDSYYISSAHRFDFIEDLLQPMADLEKYQGCYFGCIRSYAIDILDYTDEYADMFNVGEFLIEEFKVPADLIYSTFDATIDECISYVYESFSRQMNLSIINAPDVLDTLNDLFVSKRAYERFMDKLPCLLINCGIVLYTVLLCLLGPIPELVNNQSLCNEYFENSEK